MDTDNNDSLPNDLAACHALINEQASEMEKLRKLLSRLVNGSRSEKRILSGPSQAILPFETEEEYQSAKEEAEAEAKQIVDQYTVTRHERNKKRRNESLPAHLPRVKVEIDAALKNCPEHGERKQMGEDVVETLVIEPPKAYVEVRRYPKLVCEADRKCGVASSERPTGLVEGNRYSPSVAAAVIETRGAQLSVPEREQLRARESAVILASMRKWFDSPVVADVLPKSDFAEALRYIRNHWAALKVYTTDGRIPIDNNSVE